jgi:hypothetical protein
VGVVDPDVEVYGAEAAPKLMVPDGFHIYPHEVIVVVKLEEAFVLLQHGGRLLEQGTERDHERVGLKRPGEGPETGNVEVVFREVAQIGRGGVPPYAVVTARKSMRCKVAKVSPNEPMPARPRSQTPPRGSPSARALPPTRRPRSPKSFRARFCRAVSFAASSRESFRGTRR